MKSYRIHLIRCGYTENTLKGIYEGQYTDVPLCDESIRQIRDMVENSIYPYVQTVFIPNLERCFDTYMLIYPDSQYAKMEGLTECDFGEYDGKSPDELADDPVFVEWLKGNPDFAAPDGESNREFAARVCTTFGSIVEALMTSGTEEVAIIATGGVIMTICAFFALPEMSITEWLTPPGTGYTLRTENMWWHSGRKCELMQEIPIVQDGDIYE